MPKKAKSRLKPKVKTAVKRCAKSSAQVAKLKKQVVSLKRAEAEYRRLRAECEHTKRAFQQINDFSTALLTAMPFAVDIVDSDGRILFMNKNLEALVGRDALGKKCWLRYKDDKKQCPRCPLLKGISVGKTEITETSNAFGGRTFYITHSGMMYKGRKAVLEIFQDITARKEMEDTLRELAVVDELTQLYNRRGFFTLATHQLKLAQRQKTQLTLFFIDVDNMKWINDNLGHREGDAVLAGIAKVLKHTYRASDIIARIGGDEFVVLAVGTGVQNANSIFSRLLKNIKNYNAVSNIHHQVSVSTGRAYYHPARPQTIEELLEQADRQMYKRKATKTAV